MGHLAKMCRDKNSTNSGNTPKKSQSNPAQQSHKTNLIERTDQEEPLEQLQILATHVTPQQQEGTVVHAKLNGHPVNMQLDTGSTVTLLGETTWEDIDCPSLQPSEIKLQNYSHHKFKVHLTLKADVQPKFCKSRLPPFSIKPAIEQDLERQVHNGVLQRVEYSEWATPIVVVPKPSKAVRICGDFSVTVNPELKINQYPLPRPEELLPH